MTLFQLLDYTGTIAFAASGALAGARKNLDFYGIAFLAIVTAVGGGTVRDALLGRVPPFFFTQIIYFILSAAATVVVFAFYSHMKKTYSKLVWMDALGLGVFNVIGMTVAMESGVGYFGSICCGVITGTGGGMIRDVLIGEIPFVLKSEVYATACIVSGILFCALHYLGVNMQVNMAVASFVLFAVRMITFKLNIGIPKIKQAG